MTTRSATKAPRVAEEEEAAEPLLLDKLAPEILNIIAEALAADEDILIPRHLGSLARSCKVIKKAVKDAKDKLKVKYNAASALLRNLSPSRTVEEIVDEQGLGWRGLTAADAPALTNVLKSKALEQVEVLNLALNQLGHEGAAAVAAAGAAGGLPWLTWLNLNHNIIEAAGMQSLASALAGGAFRKLETLLLRSNKIGNAGIAALAASLENGALPNLKKLSLSNNSIGEEGMKALMAAGVGGGLSKLQDLFIENTELSDEGIEALAEAIENGNLPSLGNLDVGMHWNNPRLRAACEEHQVKLGINGLYLVW